MKYNSILIRADTGKWKVFSYDGDGEERYDTETQPQESGFYYYQETMSKETAFEKLKEVLIKAHKRNIKNLQKSLEKLVKLKLNSAK